MAIFWFMMVTDPRQSRASSARPIGAVAGLWLRLLAVCFVIATSAGCSWVETVADSGSDSDRVDDIADGGDDDRVSPPVDDGGDGPVVPSVLPYTARWRPSSSPGVEGYVLSIASTTGAIQSEYDIPLAQAGVSTGGVLSYTIDLETDRTHMLRMRAYDGDVTSAPSNAVFVSPDALIAGAAGSGASAALAPQTASAAGASPSSGATGSGDVAPSPTATATASAEDPITAATEAWVSLELAGDGAHLVSTLDARLEASTVTLTTWLRPFVDATPERVLAALTDADGTRRLALTVVDGSGLRVTLRDATGGVAAEAEYVGVLEHDVWQHLAFVIDPTVGVPLELRVGGELLTPLAAASAPGIDALQGLTGVLSVGGADLDAGYLGRMGHTAVFARALGADELVAMDLDGHAHDPRTDLVDDGGLLHYWRLGEGGGFEADLGGSDWPTDLEATATLYAVEDAPQPLE